jgi:hypothetical protein
LLGPRPTWATAEESGAVIPDLEETLELDPEWTKQRLFGRYCYNLGYTVKQSANGILKFGLQVDEDWVTGGAEIGTHCSRASFLNFWNGEHSNIIVRKPSKDICGICYQFHIGNRSKRSNDNRLDSDDEDNDDAIPTQTK